MKVITDESFQDFKDKTDELDKLLTERIQAFHGVPEMIQARHSYIFYRKMLWESVGLLKKEF